MINVESFLLTQECSIHSLKNTNIAFIAVLCNKKKTHTYEEEKKTEKYYEKD